MSTRDVRAFNAFCASQERRVQELLARLGRHVQPVDRRESAFRTTHAPSTVHGRFSTPIPRKPVCP